ncbi:hypothetical protein OIU34_18320 [Pararhizobium sp. BT-229]|uniref:hypothetical protein n=1 Tax=Pararhizobium sp. BT-229 TaxID=2986923 RepID=UPI0021F7CC0E|nr:hypothetical protein [Pararhizobium sp. BT-229]MCV9963836.1 hypothetical protein [Pararhizobium sp. BT-229]
MSETTFHLMDAATGRFLRQYGGSMHTRAYLSPDGDGPAYSTSDIADIHRLMRLGENDRTPYGLPAIDHVEDEFYCVAAVKRYGSVVPGGDDVLLSTDLVKVELEELRTPRVVRSRKFSETPRIVLKRYVPEDILSRIDAMDPEFLVLNGEKEPIAAGEFVLAENYAGARIGEVLHSMPLPESWPLSPGNEEDGLALVLVDYASKTNSYSVSDLPVVERPTNGASRPRTP